ncbi:MAG: uroporphyrinogen-III C-methyltransferase [Gammaproteobacteria bacterium]|nr:uroporphyrinogen-III C-methyltransferase [Gammaproteobacteria bacterium]
MDFLPIFINLRGRSCLLVGGGEVAGRKARLLLEAGARLTVVAPKLGPTLTRYVADGNIEHQPGLFIESQLDGCTLVFAATDDGAVNRQVHAAALARRIPVNVVDRPDLCTFIMPSIVDRSPVVAAVSTSGSAPVLARLIRARLETLIPSGYGRLGKLVADFRQRVKQQIKHPAQRRRFWEVVLDGPIAEQVLSGRESAARAALEHALEHIDGDAKPQGAVYLVGAGPGDPDLLTFRALRLMQQADVVVYDRLVSREVLNLVRREAELIYAGKERDKHTLPQEDINHLLVRLAKAGKRVVRLKGGDPFIFGRGGEEIDTLAAAGVLFEVVPGITAAVGCAAYAGIPLTHRDYAHSVIFATGHLKDGSLSLNWESLIQPQQTLVFYMGLHGVRPICRELIARGLSDSTPAALVQQGTTQQQRVLTGTLASLPDIVDSGDVKPPTLIIIGEVVRLREKLHWFESPQ